MKTVDIGNHKVTAPNRSNILPALDLFIEALALWNTNLFSTGTLVASDAGWEILTKLMALFPVEETGAIAPLTDIANDIERIERLFLSGKSPDPECIAYGRDQKTGSLVPTITDKIIQNYSTPLLLELMGYQLWHVLPQSLEMASISTQKKD